jgi:anti-sigma-K factor RskA
MPPTPVDDHTQEFEQLAGLAALGALEGDDQVRFEEHAARCERCRLMVQLDQEALARAAPEMDPSPDFKARLMQRAAAELAAAEARASAPPPNVTPIRPPGVTPIRAPEATPNEGAPRPAETDQPEQPTGTDQPTPVDHPPAKIIPFWRRTPWASAIAALLVLGLFTAGAYSFQNQVVASYTLSGAPTGSAVVNVRRSGATELNMSGVQNPPSGYVYEAWIIPPNGQPVAAGTTPTGNATLPLSQLSSGTTVAITQEQRPVDAPTSAPIMAVVVQS